MTWKAVNYPENLQQFLVSETPGTAFPPKILQHDPATWFKAA